jgi:hypothetical protein
VKRSKKASSDAFSGGQERWLPAPSQYCTSTPPGQD